MFRHIQKGQTLIEALSALAIIGILLSATAVAVITSLSNATFNQNKTLATKYAQQGSEIVRQIRDKNYTTFQGYSGSYCLGTSGAFGGGCATPNVGNFVRTVQIQRNNGCGAANDNVIVSVTFQDSKCPAGNPYCHGVTDTSCLSITNPVQAP